MNFDWKDKTLWSRLSSGTIGFMLGEFCTAAVRVAFSLRSHDAMLYVAHAAARTLLVIGICAAFGKYYDLPFRKRSFMAGVALALVWLVTLHLTRK